jgi:clan AA aspartic protease (TIGR02281 family)
MKFLGLKAFLLSLLLASVAVAQSNWPPCPSDTLAEWNNCQGTRKIADGDYVGEWFGNRPNGRGTLTWPDGTKYMGQFHDGSISGQGIFTWANGDKYIGEFHGGKMHGMGTLVWSNGQKYVGTFSGGAMTGQGSMYAADGSVLSLATTAPSVSPLDSQESSSGEEVLLKENRGIFVVPVEINGAMTLDFALDSGASTVTIPTNVYNTLVRTGTINETDIIGQGTILLADGSKSKLPVFRIRSLKVGDKTIKDVIATVLPLGGQLLLGQSFLTRFKSWSLDNKKHVLLLNTQ